MTFCNKEKIPPYAAVRELNIRKPSFNIKNRWVEYAIVDGRHYHAQARQCENGSVEIDSLRITRRGWRLQIENVNTLFAEEHGEINVLSDLETLTVKNESGKTLAIIPAGCHFTLQRESYESFYIDEDVHQELMELFRDRVKKGDNAED